MAIRIYNSATNVHLLNKVGVKGITIQVNGGKDSRQICHCGHVQKTGDACEVCGNTEFINVSDNRWCYTPTNNVTGDGYYIDESSGTIEVHTNMLVEVDVQSTKSIDFQWKDICMLRVNENSFSRTYNVSMAKKMEEADSWFIDHIDDAKLTGITDVVKTASKYCSILYGDELSNIQPIYSMLSHPCTMFVMTDENVNKYKQFWKALVSRYNWNGASAPISGVAHTMHELFGLVGIPIQLERWVASDAFRFSYSYWYRNSKGTSQSDFDKLPENLKKTLVSCIEHDVFGMEIIGETISLITSYSKEKCDIVAKYIKRNGMQYQGRIIDELKNDIGRTEELNCEFEDILNKKKLSMTAAMELLARRGFPDSRIEGFVNIFDVNPSLGLQLLSSKAKLKQAEAEKIYK